MYATAQRVQDRSGRSAIHVFVHRHDPSDCPFPTDPKTVPHSMPGRLVWRDAELVPPGGNAVLSFVDLIVPEERWHGGLADDVRAHAKEASFAETPFEIRAGPVFMIFHAVEAHRDAHELTLLLERALDGIGQVDSGTSHGALR
jgi:hypothetical protein